MANVDRLIDKIFKRAEQNKLLEQYNFPTIGESAAKILEEIAKINETNGNDERALAARQLAKEELVLDTLAATTLYPELN